MGASELNQGGSTGFPPTGRSEEGSGAAIGQTTTYSSRPLASGDPTGSVVDHQSADPMTYRRPEAGSHTSPSPAARGTNTTNNSGLTSSSAAARAASTAWTSHNQGEHPSFPISVLVVRASPRKIVHIKNFLHCDNKARLCLAHLQLAAQPQFCLNPALQRIEGACHVHSIHAAFTTTILT